MINQVPIFFIIYTIEISHIICIDYTREEIKYKVRSNTKLYMFIN
jgi:hypothetical protein